MFLNGDNLTDLPLVERKARLKRILPKSMRKDEVYLRQPC